ncbi:MAG: Xaa-Pro peptidase family protein [Planctomycetia bacterium]|nr:Xaa-Pro peptidase family protein [Planctomycetia bacterium]
MQHHDARIGRLKRLLHKQEIGSLLVTNFTNVTYLTGFSGDDSYLLVSGRGKPLIISDPRYTTQLEEECPDIELEIRPPGASMLSRLNEVIRAAKIPRLGIESSSVSVAMFEQLKSELKDVELVPIRGAVEELRQIKDAHEIRLLRDAVTSAERAFAIVRASLRPEQTELSIAHELEHQARLFGAKGCSFSPIVAVGARAALPHAVPTQQTVSAAPFILIDWGANEPNGYKSDLTRVLVTGKIPPKLAKIYQVVLQAQLRGIEAIRPGATTHQVDKAARDVIAKAGFGKQFGHGLGHGIGLEIHEDPRLGSNGQTTLRPGMVVTVEPGIYLPGFGGVRIEDDILVTRDGHEVLTNVPKQWEDAIVV